MSGERKIGMTDDWRKSVKVHPAAEIFPMMSGDELDELAKDIAENGFQQPLIFLAGQLLDGRNRVAALHRVSNEGRRDELAADIMEGRSSVYFASHEDPIAYVVSSNLRRRHLTAEQKRDVITKLLKANPERSDRATAKIAGVHHETVA